MIFVLAASLSAGEPAEAREPLTLAPSSAWNLRYEEDKCRLVQVFGQGEQLVEMNIDQSGTEPFFNLFLLGEPIKIGRRQQTLTVQFGPDEDVAERSYLHGKIGNKKVPFLMMHGIQLGKPSTEVENGEFATEGIGPEREARIEWLAIGGKSNPALNLQLTGLGEALAALKTCSEDLVQHLGLDPNGQLRIAEKPKILNQMEMARSIHYPSLYARDGIEGNVRVRVTVNKNGEATNCQIARSSRPAVFDDLVCLGMIQKGEFQPAVDIEGNPAASYIQVDFTFQID